ncbi:hypothetical protein E4U42_004358 [Claviceps africana]|uniref:Uncharacterized protein n=1 Tax=Claviceps africana TaxID=83212 RepID=A0A8K0NP60_9HYPO|nr:hypothetical protein E4U42_004358 [Claviceps africana]
MDPGADADADAAAMAQAMGFSSFGAQDHPSKKRRYNAAADSVCSAETAPQPRATGSNSTPLAAPTAKTSINAQEIDLQDEDDETASSQAGQVSMAAGLAGLPARPGPGTGFVGGVSSEDHAHAPRFQSGKPAQTSHNELWYKDYYDRAWNENPWERLEKAMGLEMKGTWVSRSSSTAASASLIG